MSTAKDCSPGFIRQAQKLGLLTLSGSILGLLRELIIARKFGATQATDAYLVGLAIPSFLYALVIGSGLNIVLVPRLTAVLNLDRGLGNRRFAEFLAAVSVLAIAITACLFCFPGAFVTIFAPGISSSALTLRFVRLLAPMFFLFTIAYATASFHCAQHRAPYWGYINLIQNGAIVLIVILLAPLWGINSLIGATLAGGLLALMVQLRLARRWGFQAKWAWPRLRGDGVQLLVALMPFALVCGIGGDQGTHQADTFLLRFFASQLHAGTITLIALANKLVGVPILFAGAAVSISVMPSIVVAIQKRETEEVERKLLQAVTAVTLLMWPVLLFYELLAPSIVSTVFGNGALTATQLAELGTILRAYAGAVLGLSVVLVLNSFLAAFGRTRTVIVAGVITVCINAISMAIVVRHWGAPGIALALTAGTFIYAGLLTFALRGSIGFRSIGRLLPPVARVIVGGFPLYIGVLAAGQLSRFLGWHSLVELSVQLVFGGGAYLGWLHLQSSKIDMGIFNLRVGTMASGRQSFEASAQDANNQQEIEAPLPTEVAHEREI